MKKSDIAVIGMGVMGRNLALNLESRGYKVSIYNRTTSLAEEVIAENPDKNFELTTTLQELADSLQTPRKVILMIKAGSAVDYVIEDLEKVLDKGDIIIDGGNSYFKDTKRRYTQLKTEGFNYVGLGVSGGETGARLGPALMPGADKQVYEQLKPFFDAIAAKAEDGTACAAYLGTDGAGHYVKMVHNGIEYADMELIAEAYYMMRKLAHLSNEQLSQIFQEWNQGLLASYLIEITSNILKVKDGNDNYVVDKILDVAMQKGTGKWTNLEAVDLGVDTSILLAGLNARIMSMLKAQRIKAEQIFDTNTQSSQADNKLLVQDVQKALLATKILAYAQGFTLYRKASEEYGWDLNYSTIASSFRAGCIIRSKLLQPMMDAFDKDPALENLIFDDYFADLLKDCIPALRRFVVLATENAIAIPAFSAALAYFDQYTTANSSANIIQAQRDYFGAHTYRRTDKEGTYHNEWEKALEKDSHAPLAMETKIND